MSHPTFPAMPGRARRVLPLLAAGLASTIAAGGAHAVVYADVVSATPVTAQVDVPRRECADGERLVQRQPSGVGALVGAIAGGVIGNQFGSGSGRAAATVAGVVGGSVVGNAAETNGQPYASVPVRQCRTVVLRETRTVGWDVVYDHDGVRHRTRLDHDPGSRLALDVRPVGETAPRVAERDDRPIGRMVGRPVPALAVAPSAYGDEGATVVASEPRPAVNYYEQAPAGFHPAPTTVYVQPSYGYHGYGYPYYAGPAIGIGFWGGWHGHRHWHGGRRHHRR